MASLKLIGLRSTGYSMRGGDMLAILKTASGRRLNVKIPESETMEWEKCKTAILAALVAEEKGDGDEEIDEPDDNASDMPWHHAEPTDKPFGQSGTVSGGGTEAASLRAVGFSRKSNADYLREIAQEATFSVSSQIEANNARIAELQSQVAESRIKLVEEYGEKTMQPIRDRLLVLTPLGQAVIASRGRR